MSDKTLIQMYKAQCLHRLKGRWMRLPDLPLASKWIHLVDPFLALPCMHKLFICMYDLGCSAAKFFGLLDGNHGKSLPLGNLGK